MKDTDEDSRLIFASVDELEPYLSSDTTFWRIPSLNIPLTVGNLLLAIERQSNLQKRTHKSTAADSIERLYSIRQRHHSKWNEKITHEIPVRLKQWQGYLDEIQDQQHLDQSFAYNVRTRVILELLIHEIGSVEVATEVALDKMDQELMKFVSAGKFVWDPVYQTTFPEDMYWYLYTRIGGEGK